MCARTCFLSALVTTFLCAGKPVWVTIFLHGGGTHPLYFSLSDAFKVMHERIDGSVYEKTTRFLRYDPYFFQVQPMQHMGLRKAYPLKHMDKRYGAHIFGEFYAHMNDLAGFAPTLMYSFGWSSLLSITARRAAARELYKSLLALIKYMQSQGLEPRIRLLAFSHGGNVALYLAEAARAYAHTPFVIEEFILISTPVQPDTDLYLKSKIFKKIYLFYSVGDNIQSSDFLSSSEHVFARHFFVDRRTSELPACVTQIQVRFIRKKFVMTKKDGTEKVFYRRDLIQPNHTEMYFFGWTPEWYRRYFPIKPLPVILLIPIIMRALEKNHICCNRIRVTIIPEESRMEIYVKATDTKIEVPFLPRPLLDEIRQDLWKLQPTNMNEYRWRMKEHWKHAQAIVREEYRAKSRPSKYRMRSAHKKTT